MGWQKFKEEFQKEKEIEKTKMEQKKLKKEMRLTEKKEIEQDVKKKMGIKENEKVPGVLETLGTLSSMLPLLLISGIILLFLGFVVVTLIKDWLF